MRTKAKPRERPEPSAPRPPVSCSGSCESSLVAPAGYRLEGFSPVADEAIPHSDLGDEDQDRRHEEGQRYPYLRAHRLHHEPHLRNLDDDATSDVVRMEGPRIEFVVGVALGEHHPIGVEPDHSVDDVAITVD